MMWPASAPVGQRSVKTLPAVVRYIGAFSLWQLLFRQSPL